MWHDESFFAQIIKYYVRIMYFLISDVEREVKVISQ